MLAENIGNSLLWMDKFSNKDLWDRTNQVRIEIDILTRRWRWLGHTLRKHNTNITRHALAWNPQDKRNRGGGETDKHLAT